MSVFQDIVSAIHVELNDGSVLAQTGRKALKAHTQQRRIVWIRGTSSRVTPPAQLGGKAVANVDTSTDRHRTIYTLNESVEAHVFAESEDALEQLFSNLVAAMKTALHANWLPGAYEWETETGGDGVATGYTKRGEKLRFDSVWLLPTTDEIAPLTILVDQTHVCIIETPDGTGSELE